MVLHHEVGKEFQRNIALQFFIARQPDYSHSTSSADLDQRVAAKTFCPLTSSRDVTAMTLAAPSSLTLSKLR